MLFMREWRTADKCCRPDRFHIYKSVGCRRETGKLQGEKEKIMQSFEHVVQVASGLHARIAGELMRVVKSFKSDVIVQVGDRSSNLQKVLEVMNLSIRKGDNIRIAVEGIDEAIASDEIYHFLKENL